MATNGIVLPEDPNERSGGPAAFPLNTNCTGVAMESMAKSNIRRLQENVMSVRVRSSEEIHLRHLYSKSPTTLNLSTSNHESNAGMEANTNSFLSPDNDAQNFGGVLSSLTRLSPSDLASTTPTSVSVTELTTCFNDLAASDPNWQSRCFTVRDRNAVMFNNPTMADVWFIVGSEALTQRMKRQEIGAKPHFSHSVPPALATVPTKIPAHRYVLATASTVFYAMFFGGLADKDPAEPIEVPDVDPDAFMTMLKYIYCDECDLNPGNVLATLYASKKYIVPFLASTCVRYLESSLTANNACLLLSQARLFDEKALMQKSWEVIDAQAEMALGSDGFNDIDFTTMKAILGRESLNCRETVIFKAAVRWAEAECERRDMTFETAKGKALGWRDVLGSALNLVRFPSMTVQEFADTAATTGVLTLQETNDLFLHFTAKQKPSVGMFITNPRVGLPRQICRRFVSSHYRSNQWRYKGRTDSIQFCVDRRIFLIGFGLYGSSNGSSDYTARIELKSSPTLTPFGRGSRVISENTVKFFSDGSSNTFKVYFEHPVQIEPDVYHTVSAILDGAELSYFGHDGQSEVTVGSVTFQFQSSSESTNGTGVQGGQIPELIFYGPSPSPQGESVSVNGATSPPFENCQLDGSPSPFPESQERSSGVCPQGDSNSQFS